MVASHLEETLAFHLRCSNLEPVREYRFHSERKWRFDYAFVAEKVAVEIEGGIFVQGRHSRGASMLSDMDKYNAAAELGWCVLRYAGQHIKSGAAIAQIERVLALRKVDRSKAA